MRAFLLLFAVLGGMALGGAAFGQDLSQLSGELAKAEGEIRGSIFPAVAGILAAIMLIGVAAAVGKVMSRGG